MKWSVYSGISSDDSYTYIGNKIVESGCRGFNVYKDGTWGTSYFKRGKLTLATIRKNEIGYFKDDFSFSAALDEELGVIKIQVQYKGVERSLKYFSFGTWTFYNTLYYEHSDKYVTCQVANDNDQFIFAEDTSSGISGRITPLRPGVFVLKGKIYAPGKLPWPDYIHYGEVGERKEYERIYSTGKNSSRGVLMLAENDGSRYYGEAFDGKPSGFGVVCHRLKGFYSFDFSIFKRVSVINMPSLTAPENVHVSLRSFDNGSYDVIVKDNNQNHIYMKCEDGSIRLDMYTYNWESIKVDKSFSNVSVRYDKEAEKTYPLFRPKPRPTPTVNVKPTPKVTPTPKPAPIKKVVPEVSPLRKELLDLTSLSSDEHFNKYKDCYDQLVASFKKKHSYYDKMLFVGDFESILHYFGSMVDDEQFDEFSRTYAKLTARFKSSSDMEKMARRKGTEIDNSFNYLEKTLNSFDKDAPQIVYNLGKIILTLKQTIAKEAENALKRYKDKYL